MPLYKFKAHEASHENPTTRVVKLTNGHTTVSKGKGLTPGRRLLTCRVCYRVFSKQSSLWAHKADEHSNTAAQRRKQNSKEHKSRKISSSAVVVLVNRKSSVTQVKVKPKVSKPYQCRYCDKSFISPSQCKSHENAHTELNCVNYDPEPESEPIKQSDNSDNELKVEPCCNVEGEEDLKFTLPIPLEPDPCQLTIHSQEDSVEVPVKQTLSPSPPFPLVNDISTEISLTVQIQIEPEDQAVVERKAEALPLDVKHSDTALLDTDTPQGETGNPPSDIVTASIEISTPSTETGSPSTETDIDIASSLIKPGTPSTQENPQDTKMDHANSDNVVEMPKLVNSSLIEANTTGSQMSNSNHVANNGDCDSMDIDNSSNMEPPKLEPIGDISRDNSKEKVIPPVPAQRKPFTAPALTNGENGSIMLVFSFCIYINFIFIHEYE